MKKAILFLSIIIAVNAQSQSLKDLLYGGKLKTDSNSVLRKGDDLSTKIDTTTKKKPVVAEKDMSAALSLDSIKKWTSPTDTSTAHVIDKTNSIAVLKDNNKLWKDFVDSLSSTLNQEVMTSKKINKGTYYITVDYAINTDGSVAINNVLLVPENKFLEQQVKERLGIDTPKLNPVLAGNGVPRKVTKRYNFTLNKD